MAEPPSSSSLVPSLALLIIALFLTYKLLVHPIYLHPLRHIPPAHWSIPLFGSLWILRRRHLSLNNATTLAAHRQHGPVVRLGRNELSVSLVDAGIKTIYGGGFDKHPWYPQQFASYGVVNMFSTLHHAPHSQKKRTMANVYSKSYLQASPQVAANSRALVLGRFLPEVQGFVETGEDVDMHDLDNAMTMDFMSAYQYGIGASTNFTQDKAARNHVLHHYHSRRPYEFYSSEIPWLKPLGERLGIYLVPKLLDQANDILEDWGKRMCERADKWLANPTEKAGEEPIVYKQFKQGLTNLRSKDPEAARSKDDLILPTHTTVKDDTRMEVYSEMLDHLGAGHETSAVALTYMWYELAKNTTLQSALRKEIRTLNPRITWPPAPGMPLESIELPSPKQIDTLPLLHATLYEVLRLHAPIPGMQPRVTPHIPGGTTLGTYSGIPGGVRVSAMPYTLHRNAEVFPDPETFNPRRWIDSEPEKLKEMHRWFWAFGSGGRMCIGSHLAMQEMKLIVCALVGNYEVVISEGGDEEIEEIDAYTVRPKSNRLIVRWRAARV
jgi:cytochrome P450